MGVSNKMVEGDFFLTDFDFLAVNETIWVTHVTKFDAQRVYVRNPVCSASVPSIVMGNF